MDASDEKRVRDHSEELGAWKSLLRALMGPVFRSRTALLLDMYRRSAVTFQFDLGEVQTVREARERYVELLLRSRLPQDGMISTGRALPAALFPGEDRERDEAITGLVALEKFEVWTARTQGWLYLLLMVVVPVLAAVWMFYTSLPILVSANPIVLTMEVGWVIVRAFLLSMLGLILGAWLSGLAFKVLQQHFRIRCVQSGALDGKSVEGDRGLNSGG